MTPVVRLAAHKLRARWRGWAALAVLIAIAGGAVLAAAAGALRTDTAYPRFLAASRAAGALVSPAGPGMSGFDAALATLPGVTGAAPVVGINAEPVRPDGTLDQIGTVFAPLDGRFGHSIEIPKLLAGRLPAANAPGEVAVDNAAVSLLHLHVGSVLPIAAFYPDPSKNVRRFTERVVGIFIASDSIVPVNDLAASARILASTALYRELGQNYWAFDGAYLTLKPAESISALTDSAQALAKRYRLTGGQVFVSDQTVQAATVERAIRPQAIALALFALALALTALLVVGQVAIRLLIGAASDNAALAALGLTRRQLLAAGLAEVAAAVAAGAAGAVCVAIAASPLTPIGPARLAEPHPGWRSPPGGRRRSGQSSVPPDQRRLARTAVCGSPSGSHRPERRSRRSLASASRSTRGAAGTSCRCAAPCSASRSRWPPSAARSPSARTCSVSPTRPHCTGRPGTSRGTGSSARSPRSSSAR
jgi:hypothetical protein